MAEVKTKGEVIFNRAFAATSYDKNICKTCTNRLFNNVLNRRFINDWKHLFWLALCRWEETGTEPSRGNNRLSNCLGTYQHTLLSKK